jgi:uncharacterized protein YydD (DUF2326 family)
MIFDELRVFSFESNMTLKVYNFNHFGLNIILGEKKEENNEANTVGKTTMVESLKYLLAGNLPKDFKNKELLFQKDIFLVLKIFINSKSLFLGRQINNSEKGYILYSKDFIDNLLVWDEFESKVYKQKIEQLFFGEDCSNPPFSGLKEYIFRDEKKGFTDIVLSERSSQQSHMYLAYLCGLPFKTEKEIGEIKKKEKELRDRIKLIDSISDKIHELRLTEGKLVKKSKELNQIIKNLDIAKKINNDANTYRDLKGKIELIQQKIFQLDQSKKQYEKNIANLENKLEQIKAFSDIQPFFEQLTGYFPEKITKNYQEISNFYNFMVDNRGKYFKNKIDDIGIELNELYIEKKNLESMINISTNLIKSKELVSDLTAIMTDINSTNAELAEVRVKIKTYEQKGELNAEINILKEQILRLTQLKYDEFLSCNDKIGLLTDMFNRLIWEAYGEEGFLEFEFENGTALNNVTGRIKIKCNIPDEKSHGRWYMKINMFDLSWFLSGLNSDLPVKFLVHDGSYCKPDRDIKAKLLKYVDSILRSYMSGQYIITINDDELDPEDLGYFKRNGSIIAELDRKNNDKNRFFGFKYTS